MKKFKEIRKCMSDIMKNADWESHNDMNEFLSNELISIGIDVKEYDTKFYEIEIWEKNFIMVVFDNETGISFFTNEYDETFIEFYDYRNCPDSYKLVPIKVSKGEYKLCLKWKYFLREKNEKLDNANQLDETVKEMEELWFREIELSLDKHLDMFLDNLIVCDTYTYKEKMYLYKKMCNEVEENYNRYRYHMNKKKAFYNKLNELEQCKMRNRKE